MHTDKNFIITLNDDDEYRSKNEDIEIEADISSFLKLNKEIDEDEKMSDAVIKK